MCSEFQVRYERKSDHTGFRIVAVHVSWGGSSSWSKNHKPCTGRKVRLCSGRKNCDIFLDNKRRAVLIDKTTPCTVEHDGNAVPLSPFPSTLSVAVEIPVARRGKLSD